MIKTKDMVTGNIGLMIIIVFIISVSSLMVLEMGMKKKFYMIPLLE
jgi:hypothetical protein